jgi:pSer/pThr/pTyr-binding forkhead associated (FHA) protein
VSKVFDKEAASVSENPQAEPKKTTYLNLPSDAKPMQDRQPRPGTKLLSSQWRVNFKIGSKTASIQVANRIIVGRAADEVDDVQLDLTPYHAYENGVSRKHAAIMLIDGSLYIEDLDSTNGTRINGFQLTPNRKYRLRDGDEVEFARIQTNIGFEEPSD